MTFWVLQVILPKSLFSFVSLITPIDVLIKVECLLGFGGVGYKGNYLD